MVWDTCNITFNRSDEIFYTGDIITGTVVLKFKHTKHIKYIDFQVIGLGKAFWTRASPTIPYIKIYSQKVKLYDVTIDIFRDLNGVNVKSGTVTYPFDFILPPNAPPTFKSSIATVEYYVQITSQTSCNMTKRKKIPMCVLNKLNLNDVEEYKVPTLFELTKTLWNSGNISVYIKTYRGFTTKQKIPIQVIIRNEKKVIVSKIRLTLIQKRYYTVTSGHHEDEKPVSKVIHTDFKNEKHEICELNMDVPWLLPSSGNESDALINICYILRVEIYFLFHCTIYKDIPIKVSSLPVTYQPFTIIK